MKQAKTAFVCQSCGHESLRWSGRCPACNQWNTLVEEPKTKTTGSNRHSGGWVGAVTGSVPVALPDVAVKADSRITTGIGEIDRVLGGGLVPGSVVLIGGDPGIGKSTLLLQLAEAVAKLGLGSLYVSGEESPAQIRLRADRLGALSPSISLLAETDMERIAHFATTLKPHLLIIDSIQTMHDNRNDAVCGSVGQVRDCTAQLTAMAKTLGIVCFIIGHVTKAGAIAGPRVLEHMVDTVLYFEGDRHHMYRVVRAVKNRFGSTNEIGVFEIRDSGLVEVENPSALWVGGMEHGVPGSVVTCAVEGSRPMLLEVQALVANAGASVPRRVTMGIDHNRAAIVAAVLEKRAGLVLAGQDTYVSVVGGFTVDEPASDLAVAMALASSARNIAAPADAVVFGEVGLAGEVRGVGRVTQRVAEAAKLGYRRCYVPKANMPGLEHVPGMDITGVGSVVEALDMVF